MNTRLKFSRRLLGAVIAAGLAAGLSASGALADDAGVTKHSVRVAIGDLDLGTPSGQAALQSRIDAAAREACGPKPVFHVDYRFAARFLDADYAKCRSDAAHLAMAVMTRRGVRVAAR